MVINYRQLDGYSKKSLLFFGLLFEMFICDGHCVQMDGENRTRERRSQGRSEKLVDEYAPTEWEALAVHS